MMASVVWLSQGDGDSWRSAHWQRKERISFVVDEGYRLRCMTNEDEETGCP